MTITPTRAWSNILADGTDLRDLVDEAGGHISRRIYGDPEIFELEKERIFRRAWNFLAHESEFTKPGDTITRTLAGEPVVLIMGDDHKVRAFLNSCRHRGMRVCRADRDNLKFMRCVYHGWAYNRDGSLAGVFAEQLYDESRLVKEELGLIPVTQVDSYAGFIFGTWSAEAPALGDFLGKMTFYLDLIANRTPAGTEVVGVPHVWEAAANWKFATDNFTGDNFHIYTAHGSMVELGLVPADPMALSGGYLIQAEGGHVLHVVPGPPDYNYLGVPRDMIPRMNSTLSTEQQQVMENISFSVGTVFPNFSFLHVLVARAEGLPPTPFLSFRFWEPVAHNRTRIHSYLFVDKDSPQSFKQETAEAYVRTFGPSGTFEQDDTENWEDCTAVNSGKIAQRYNLHHGMALDVPADPTFPGPGHAYPGSYGERTQLAFYGEWLRWLTETDPAAARSENDR
ncbi:aromatic ring-hydroxylating dioxygenase subunit alpha [Rhodococcus sp. IEGM 1381]|uniref:aromatic ring-hydroxylating oxygenase subunit alpha n=1 Tax=Rhodococcus sp. IEGM 1381 TaxID=3047085 RepID=UPI0024B648CD|nr:aromatic ring-hydroxylating dioxygenase subunit alpha [Rhodococcus sp. IEGM 1381]MDI9897433.1 aromatic ring-hydroxylating dioxygenase subunit alpha [Rhodococcus sp. IEGM 1381]